MNKYVMMLLAAGLIAAAPVYYAVNAQAEETVAEDAAEATEEAAEATAEAADDAADAAEEAGEELVDCTQAALDGGELPEECKEPAPVEGVDAEETHDEEGHSDGHAGH